MANEVYLLTHDGLSHMVSSRAATRLLEKALESKGHAPDAISADEMREVLLGPISRELKQILPRDGVDRSVKQLVRALLKQQAESEAQLAAVMTADAAASLTATPSSPVVVSGDVLLVDENGVEREMMPSAEMSPLLSDSQAFDTGEVEAALENALGENWNDAPVTSTSLSSNSASSVNHQTSTVVPVAPPVQATQISVQSHLRREYSAEELADILVQFAQLDNVKVVAAVKPNGEISMSRGSGFDVNALSRIGSLGLKLLSRGRVIRSYYLSHSHYQLFLFPLSTHTLIVVGSSDVNVGEVFSTLSRLEEDI